MKKFLISVFMLIMSVTLVFGFAACRDNEEQVSDADIAQKAIEQVKSLYGSVADNDDHYDVLGQVKVNEELYDIVWTVSSETANIENYVSIGQMDATSKVVRIKLTMGEETINFKLKATVKVGEAEQSAEFAHKLNAKPADAQGTADDPYSTRKVIEIANSLQGTPPVYYYSEADKGAATPTLVWVEGYLVEWGDEKTFTGGGRVNFVYIVENYTEDSTRNSADALCIASIDYDEENLTCLDDLAVGKRIVVKGYIELYQGGSTTTPKPEIAYFKDAEDKYHNVYCEELEKEERTPQEKVELALGKVESTLSYNKAGDYDLPASTIPGVTFTWSTTDQTYTINNNKLHIATLPETDATVTATVTATCGTETVTNNTKTVTITIKAQTEPTPGKGDGTVDHPYSVAEATAIIAGLGTETVYKVNGQIALVYVKGIVTVKGTTDSYGIKNYFMADVAGDTENDISLFSLNWGTVKNGTEINVGDTIIVTGYLQNFNGTYEVSSYKDTSWHNGTVEAHTPAGGTVDPDPQPTEGLLYTLTSTTKGENANANDINSYTASSPCTVGGITWDVLGNTQIGSGSYDVPNWRFGGKSANCNSADRTITGRGAINGTVKSIVITFGGTSGSITVNSVTLKVYSTDPGTGSPTPIAEKTVEWEANGTYTVTADDAGWTDRYYQLVMNLTTANSKNKWIVVDNIKFYGGESSVEPQPQPENNGTAEHPFKPSEAVAYGKENLATSDATTTTEVYVKGYVIDVGSWKGTYWQYVYIADDLNAKTSQLDVVIEVYKLYPDSTNLILSGDLIKGREITVHGYLKNYTSGSGDKAKTTYEFDDYKKDNDTVHPVASFASTLTREEKLNAAKAAIGNLASDDVISGFDLPAVTVSGVSYAWTVTPTTYAQIVTEQNVSKLQITRPENGTGNQTVTLSLTITCDGTEEQTPLTWELTIKQKPSTTTESELYILPTAHQTSGSNNSYTGNCDVTYNGVKWNIEGNSQSSPWRFGGKSLTAQDRKLTGKTAIQGKVSKVLLTLTDGGGITVNSVTLKVYKTDPTSNGAEAVSTKTVTTYTKDQTITFTAEGGEDWTNCYFVIIFNVTVTGSNNKYVAISNLEFRGTAVEA